MDPWAILFLLLVGGLLLLLVEFLLVPGFGLAGVVGLSAIVFSIGYAIFAAFIAQSIAVNTAMTFIFSSIIVSAGLVVMAIKYLPKTALGRRLILESSFKSEAGYVGSNENLEQMAGATGKTITPIHFGVVGRGESGVEVGLRRFAIAQSTANNLLDAAFVQIDARTEAHQMRYFATRSGSSRTPSPGPMGG